MPDFLSDMGDVLFSLIIGYMGALEFWFVVRHLYHWSFRHANMLAADELGLKQLQDDLRKKLSTAEANEAAAGAKAMQDGVLYEDGFRIAADRVVATADDDNDVAKEQRRKELEIELAKQRQIEEQTRKQLEEAEAELARQLQMVEEEEENAQKLIEAETKRAEQQRHLELQLRNEQRENMAAEQREEQEEKHKELAPTSDISRRLIESLRQHELDEDDELEREENVANVSLHAKKRLENVRQQGQIEENARKFLEAEKEMLQLQQQHVETKEPLFIQKSITLQRATPERLTEDETPRLTQTIKTQFDQTNNENYTVNTKPLLFPGVSDEGSSIEPDSSQRSSFSTQPSDELITTGTEDVPKVTVVQFPQCERQEPDGEDKNNDIQYTDEYLRSLDGIKHRPLVREDGSGRRRAFKKRRSSGSSNSSRDSRISREEELKMFTSLEEEEMQQLETDYKPIKYNTDQTLKAKPHTHRRHKRSPVKDMKTTEDNLRSSLEMLGEETTNPWGELTPEHYKDTEFWKREKAMSIDEEEFDLTSIGAEVKTDIDEDADAESAINVPVTSRFEKASTAQNEAALTVLQKQSTKEEEELLDTEKATSENKSSLIFSGEYTKAMDKDWHSGHFCCWQCDESLTGQRYVIRDDHPYCIKCYENVFANTCEECNKIIGIDSKDLSYKDKHWHEACFLCFKCHLSLVDKQFGAKADKIYCGTCYDAQFASRCDGCGEVFRAGTKKMEYKTRQWHENCFCCCVCKTAIGTKSFIPREQEIYCAGCYEEKFATRCIKCNKVITSGGVTYKNEPWHRECFTCTHCNLTLAGQRFTSRDEKPYCAECFGELFAKRCTSCVKPITGIGGTRFISFEDRHWHHDCFVCASCKTSLVGRGFITDGPDIICPECAKQKIM